jgi:hypothetical protein
MESIKSQMKMPISMDLHLTISKISQKRGIDKDSALEAGSYVSAQFMKNLLKSNFENNRGSLSKEEINAIFENVADFYSESFKDQFTQSDFEIITQKTMQIVMSPDSEKVLSEYFSKVRS